MVDNLQCMDLSTSYYVIAALVVLLIGFFLGKRIGKALADHSWERRLPSIRAEATKRSRAVVGGKVSEQLAPLLPGFEYLPSEVRFLGSPVDLVVFRGLDAKAVEELVFVEVKTGASRLSPVERGVREAIEQGKVRYEVFRPGNE
jgi:predicted Holliday junction resolvase-like endonuclease